MKKIGNFCLTACALWWILGFLGVPIIKPVFGLLLATGLIGSIIGFISSILKK